MAAGTAPRLSTWHRCSKMFTLCCLCFLRKRSLNRSEVEITAACCRICLFQRRYSVWRESRLLLFFPPPARRSCPSVASLTTWRTLRPPLSFPTTFPIP